MSLFDIFRKKSEQDRFADLILREFRKRSWPGELIYTAGDFTIRLGKDHTMFLHNHFRSWQAEPSENKQAVITRAVAATFEIWERQNEDRSFEALQSSIWPAIRGRTHFENLWMVDGSNKGATLYAGAHQPFCDGLSIILTINETYNISICNTDTLKGWNKTFEQVLPVAVNNLREQKPIWFNRHEDGFHFAESEDCYECTLPLLPEAFSRLELDGYPVVLIPTRNTLFVAGSDDFASIDAMCKAATEIYKNESRPISLLPICLKDGRWQSFAGTEEGHEPLNYLLRMSTAQDYFDQKATLEEHFKRTGRDVFVASVSSFTPPNGGKTHFMAGVFEGVVELLPQVDILSVQNSRTDDIILRKFADVMSVLGPMPIEPDTYPPRYQFDGKLTEAQWERLKREFPPIDGVKDKLRSSEQQG